MEKNPRNESNLRSLKPPDLKKTGNHNDFQNVVIINPPGGKTDIVDDDSDNKSEINGSQKVKQSTISASGLTKSNQEKVTITLPNKEKATINLYPESRKKSFSEPNFTNLLTTTFRSDKDTDLKKGTTCSKPKTSEVSSSNIQKKQNSSVHRFYGGNSFSTSCPISSTVPQKLHGNDKRNKSMNHQLNDDLKKLIAQRESFAKDGNIRGGNHLSDKKNKSGNRSEMYDTSREKDNYLKEDEKLIKNAPDVLELYLSEKSQRAVFKYLDENSKSHPELCNNCLKMYEGISPIHSDCGHNVCNECYHKLQSKLCHQFKNKKAVCHEIQENISHKVCPFCIERFKIIKLSDKYVIFCLGEETEIYKWHNGGYLDVHLCFIPDNKTETYEHVTWEKNDKILKRLHEIIKEGYIIILQNTTAITKWAQATTIDFFKDKENIDKIIQL